MFDSKCCSGFLPVNLTMFRCKRFLKSFLKERTLALNLRRLSCLPPSLQPHKYKAVGSNPGADLKILSDGFYGFVLKTFEQNTSGIEI